MADMGMWIVPTLPEEDQVVSHMPERYGHYNPWMPVLPLPISPDESFEEEEPEEEEDPFEEEEPLEEEV